MLGRAAAEFGAMGPPNEEELTHTGLEYVQDGSTGPEGTSFAAFGRGALGPPGARFSVGWSVRAVENETPMSGCVSWLFFGLYILLPVTVGFNALLERCF